MDDEYDPDTAKDILNEFLDELRSQPDEIAGCWVMGREGYDNPYFKVLMFKCDHCTPELIQEAWSGISGGEVEFLSISDSVHVVRKFASTIPSSMINWYRAGNLFDFYNKEHVPFDAPKNFRLPLDHRFKMLVREGKIIETKDDIGTVTLLYTYDPMFHVRRLYIDCDPEELVPTAS